MWHVRRLTSDVWCGMSEVWSQMSDVACQTSDVVCQTSDVRCLIWYVRRMTYDIRHQTSDIIHLTSDVSRTTSDIGHETYDIRRLPSNHQTSHVKCLMWYVRRLMSDVWVVCQMSDVRCLVRYVWCEVSDVVCIKLCFLLTPHRQSAPEFLHAGYIGMFWAIFVVLLLY